MTRVRLALEILCVALYLAAHIPLAWIYALGSSLQGVIPALYWAALGLGYLAMLGLVLARPARWASVRPRSVFDAWLLTALSALALTAAFVWMRWPLEFTSWDAHGLGARGGEANAALFPWTHTMLWAGALAYIGSRQSAHADARR